MLNSFTRVTVVQATVRRALAPVCILLAAMLVPMLAVAPAHAQATRTWVSGVGDDLNDCSRTAPCKTFAGAISKTAAGGEINCLDPGGFGAVTITKAIMISCETGTAGVLVQGTNAIIVNAGTGDVVFLKGLDIEGLGTGLNGISFLAGKGLYVTNCVIRGFATNAINFAPSTVNASLVVQDTIVADNVGGGILVKPSGGFSANALLANTQMVRGVFGLRVEDRGKTTVFNSSASSNSNNGFIVVSAAVAAEINLTHSVTANNGTNGIQSNGANALVRIYDTSILDNASNGISLVSGGTVMSTNPATNLNAGSGTPGAPNAAPVSLQ
jgi:hypothetical protein